MGTAKFSAAEYKEKYEQLLRENKAMSRGADLHNQAWEKMMKDAQTLQAQNARLMADLNASQATVIRLGQEINVAGQAGTEEVIRLRELCLANGIDPNS